MHTGGPSPSPSRPTRRGAECAPPRSATQVGRLTGCAVRASQSPPSLAVSGPINLRAPSPSVPYRNTDHQIKVWKGGHEAGCLDYSAFAQRLALPKSSARIARMCTGCLAAAGARSSRRAAAAKCDSIISVLKLRAAPAVVSTARPRRTLARLNLSRTAGNLTCSTAVYRSNLPDIRVL